jgi:hypothetical protein
MHSGIIFYLIFPVPLLINDSLVGGNQALHSLHVEAVLKKISYVTKLLVLIAKLPFHT